MSEPLKMLLWPNGAPGAKGEAVEDKPDLTLYMPENYDISKPRGLVVVLPGGGYHFKAAHEGEPIAKMLNAAGIPAVVVQYRVSPYRYPIPAEDARRAIRLVRYHAAEWHIDPNHVGILGFSAGGHCAATASTIFESTVLNPDDPVDDPVYCPDPSGHVLPEPGQPAVCSECGGRECVLFRDKRRTEYLGEPAVAQYSVHSDPAAVG